MWSLLFLPLARVLILHVNYIWFVSTKKKKWVHRDRSLVFSFSAWNRPCSYFLMIGDHRIPEATVIWALLLLTGSCRANTEWYYNTCDLAMFWMDRAPLVSLVGLRFVILWLFLESPVLSGKWTLRVPSKLPKRCLRSTTCCQPDALKPCSFELPFRPWTWSRSCKLQRGTGCNVREISH